jgi:glycerol-3-phosphate dehydrogenase
MKRDISALNEKEFDILIIGAGMFGVCAAWEAVLQGFSVAIIEKGDFCQATSANHYKMVHGGIRYLQHGDIYRIRESSRERSALLRIAPHLVKPLPIVIPTYGHSMKGKEVLRVGTILFDLLTADRNSGIPDEERKIPGSRFISKKELLNLFPGVNENGLTGAGLFADAQMYNPPRLALSFLRSAVENGAVAANYAEVLDFLVEGKKVIGVKVRDLINDDVLNIRSKIALNTAGPWADKLLEDSLNLSLNPKPSFSRDAAFITKKKPTTELSLATTLKTKDVDALFDRGGRHVFIVPWLERNITMVGVWHMVWPGTKDKVYVTEEELQEFINEVNEAYPAINLSMDDVSMVNTGLTLFGETKPGSKKMSFGKRSLLIDHSKDHSIDGLITLIGVRATIARGMAEKAMKLIGEKLNRVVKKSETEKLPIFGGKIEVFEDYLSNAEKNQKHNLKNNVMRALIHNYGSEYEEVLKYINEDVSLTEPLPNSTVLKAEIVHAIRDEMAQNLSDIVLRRTDLGTAGDPGDESLEACAEIASKEFKWGHEKIDGELNNLKNYFKQKGAIKNYSSL